MLIGSIAFFTACTSDEQKAVDFNDDVVTELSLVTKAVDFNEDVTTELNIVTDDFNNFYNLNNSFSSLEKAQEELQELDDQVDESREFIEALEIPSDGEAFHQAALDWLDVVKSGLEDEYPEILAGFYSDDETLYNAALSREADFLSDIDDADSDFNKAQREFADEAGFELEESDE